MRNTVLFLFLFALLGAAGSCKREKESRQAETPDAYLNLASGKFLVYRLDSTVFPNAGRSVERRSYQERHLVDSLITNNQGEKVWRIFRFLRDSAGTQAWRPAGTYTIGVSGSRVEFTEDNLRVLRLLNPVREGATWRGNQFLPAQPYQPLYDFSIDDDMGAWEYRIMETDGSLTLNGRSYAGVITVEHVDESINADIAVPTAYGARIRSVDKFAKGLGLIYQHFILWEYQPATGPGTTPFTVGFAVERSLLQHN